MNEDLKACPFCAAGEFHWTETPLNNAPDMSGRPSSVELMHLCGGRPPGVFQAGVTVRAKTRELAVAQWNRREPHPALAVLGKYEGPEWEAVRRNMEGARKRRKGGA